MPEAAKIRWLHNTRSNEQQQNTVGTLHSKKIEISFDQNRKKYSTKNEFKIKEEMFLKKHDIKD